MSEPRDDHDLADHTSTTLHDLHLVIRERVTVPPSADLRRRAERQDWVRNSGVVVAVVVVLAVLVAAWQLPKQPARPGIAASPSPGHSRSGGPPSVNVPPPPPVVDDSITRVNLDDFTLDMAPNPDVPSCPTGPVHIIQSTAEGTGADGRTFNPLTFLDRVFGDVDRDGRLDAIEPAGCAPSPGHPDETEQLLIISRRADGKLTGRWGGPVTRLRDGLASVGPYLTAWVADGVVYTDIRPGRPGPDYTLGQIRAFLWTGDRLAEIQQNRYPALLPTRYQTAPLVKLGPLAAALGCAGGTVRFTAEGKATVGTARYDTVMPLTPLPYNGSGPDPTQLFSLRSWVVIGGHRVLLARINCTGPDGKSAGAVAVLAPDGAGLTLIDAVRIPGAADAAWDYDFGNSDTLVVITRSHNPPDDVRMEWKWDGAHFRRSS